MNIKRAREEIINTVNAYLQTDEQGRFVIPEIHQRPILLMGPPGIGKTAVVEQAARMCGVCFVSYTMTHHTRQSAMGLPFIGEKTYGGRTFSVTEYTMSEIIGAVYEKQKQTQLQNGILFIDEINCVSETLAPLMLQFLQKKSFGSYQVPAGWVIVAAGNPPEYNRTVQNLDIVTLDRVKLIPVEADYAIWKEYAADQGIHRAILSYLDIHPENFYKAQASVDGMRFVTARGWEDLSRLMQVYETISLSTDEQVIGQYLQEAQISGDFANYLELYYAYEKAYNIDDILNGIIEDPILKRIAAAPFDERITVISLLLSRLGISFHQAHAADCVTDMVFSTLKQFRQQAEEGCDAPCTLFHALCTEMRQRFLLEKEGNLLSRKEEGIRMQVLHKLDSLNLSLSRQNLIQPEEAVETLRESFSRMAEARNHLWADTAALLEHAFDFMEEAFGASPEMVFFETELAAGTDSLYFIEENGCDRFYQYNQNLNTLNRRKELLHALEETLAAPEPDASLNE